MNDISKIKEVDDLIKDYNECDKYIYSLKNKNIKILNEAIKFSNNKYLEYYLKDDIITVLNTNFINSNLDDISQTICNLEAIKRMIIIIAYKKCSIDITKIK